MPIASNERLAGSGTCIGTLWAKALPDIPINTAAVPKANNDNERMVILPLSQNSPRKYFPQYLCHRFISTTY